MIIYQIHIKYYIKFISHNYIKKTIQYINSFIKDNNLPDIRILKYNLHYSKCLVHLSHHWNNIIDLFKYSISSTVSKYNNVCLGGTFDHLHSGHKVLLTIAAYMTQKLLTIGLSSMTFL